MSASEARRVIWPITKKMPRYYLPVQLLALTLAYAAFLIVSFIDGGIGPFSSIELYLIGNFIFGIAAGATSTSTGRAFIVMFGSLIGGIIFTFFILTLPSTFGVPDDTLDFQVLTGMSVQVVFSLLTVAPTILAIILGSAVHDRLGLPEE